MFVIMLYFPNNYGIQNMDPTETTQSTAVVCEMTYLGCVGVSLAQSSFTRRND